MITNPRNFIKAQIIVLVNAILGILIAVGISINSNLQVAIIVAVNAALSVWVAWGDKYINPPPPPPEP